MANDDSSWLRLVQKLASSVAGGAKNAETNEAIGEALRAAIGGSSAKDEGAAGAPPRAATTQPVELLPPLSLQNDETDRLNQRLAELAAVMRRQAETTDANTQAVIENSLARAASEKKSTASGIANTALSFLGGGFGLFQLVGRLFGGGEPEPIPAVPAYSLPAAVNVDAGVTPGRAGVHPLRYAQDGLPRPTAIPQGERTANVTVQVQAIDSRSFLDHSDEIAQAVREALLHSHSLSDVMSEF